MLNSIHVSCTTGEVFARAKDTSSTRFTYSIQDACGKGGHSLAPRVLEIECVVSEPFAENTFVVRLRENSRCLIVDPGFEPGRVIDEIQRKRLEPAAILNTHGHSDHIAGNRAMKERWP